MGRFVKPYKIGQPWATAFTNVANEKGEELDPIIFTNQPQRSFITGYTGIRYNKKEVLH